jgi:hypothetical protein
MKKDATIPFAFPVKGVDQNWARHDQPQLTTPDMRNVVIFDRFQRARGAQRPGTRKLWTTPLGDSLSGLYMPARICGSGAFAGFHVAQDEITYTAGRYDFRYEGDGLCYYVLESDTATRSVDNVATIRTASTGCDDPACGGGTNPPTYRQVRFCTTGELAPLWINTANVATTPFYFRFHGDNGRYRVDGDEPTTISPTGFVAVNITAITDCDDLTGGGACTGCGTFSWDTGTRFEHVQGGSVNFAETSPPFTVCTTGHTHIGFVGESDDITVLIHADDAVTQTYTGTAGDAVTISIPADAIIFRNTEGFLIADDAPGYPATVEKTITDGTNSHVFDAGTALNNGTGSVADMDGSGFVTRSWGFPVTVAELTSKGWIDPDGTARLKLVHIVSGNGFTTVTSINCDGATYIQGLRCGGGIKYVLLSSIAAFPYYFTEDGNCYEVLDTNTTSADPDPGDIAASPVEETDCTEYLVTPDITVGTESQFVGGASLAAGSYRVRYVEGAMKLAADQDWVLGYADYRITHSGGTEIAAPGTDTGYPTQADLEAGEAGQSVAFTHAGGTIGIRLVDSPYVDNVPGSPNPTFCLEAL